jgi:hypothetical protein
MSTVGLVSCSAGGVETIRTGLVQPLLDDGHTVAITLTPNAAVWLDELGEVTRLQDLTGLPVRSTPGCRAREVRTHGSMYSLAHR